MRYKITMRSQRKGNPFIIRLEDGSIGYSDLRWVPRPVHVGETGRLVITTAGRQKLIPDSFDSDFIMRHK